MSPPTHLIDTHDRRISNQDLRKAMRINIAAGSLGVLWFSLTFGMPLTMFMNAIGASGVLIGMITTVRLLVMTVQIPAAVISENLGSRKKFWGPLALVHRSIWLVVAAMAFYWVPGQQWLPVAVIAVVGFSEFLGNAGAAPWFSWMADLIPAKSSGRFWGIRQSFTTMASLAGMALAGWILDLCRHPGSGTVDTKGFAVVFGLAAAAGMSDIIVHRWVKEPRPAPTERRHSYAKRIFAPLRNRNFLLLTLALGAWNFGCAMITPFGVVYLKRDFHSTYSELASLAIAGSLGAIFTSYIFGHLIDRFGARLCAALLFLASPLTGLAWFFINVSSIRIGSLLIPQAIALLCAASLVAGSLFSAVALCQMRLAALLSNPHGRTMSMAMHWSLIGLLAAPGSFVGGAIMDWFTAHPVLFLLPGKINFSFYHALLLAFLVTTWCIALPLLLSIRMPVPEVAFGAVVSRLFLTNPLNVVRDIYHLQIMDANTSSQRRALAARQLGAHRSAIAVPDLIAKLNDPSMDVVEEAIEALGSIATPEAVDALLAKLGEPACDYAPQICHALRLAADPRSVDALSNVLSSTDRETLCEGARALGAIGDRRAIPHLLNLIKNTRDNKVIATSSEALAALGELSAAYQMIPQMRVQPNRMLKQAMAVAVGDLLAEGKGFYRVLIAEMETPTAGAGVVLRDLSSALRRNFPRAGRQHETVDLLETAYAEGRVADCAEMLLHLGLHVIQFIHRLPVTLDPNDAMRNLLELDRRAGICVWYLKILNERWEVDGKESRELTDVLLGLHILACLVTADRKGGERPLQSL
jgi:MFS family permease